MGGVSAQVSVEIQRQVAWLRAALAALDDAGEAQLVEELELELDHRLGLLALLAEPAAN